MIDDKYWATLADAARDIPSDEPRERAAWTTRNYCELGLYLITSGSNLDRLSALIGRSDLSLAPKNLMHRLSAICSGRKVTSPESVARVDRPPGLSATSPMYANAAMTLCHFADWLRSGVAASENLKTKASPLGELGRKAIQKRNEWRPTFDGREAAFKEMPELDTGSIRRCWMFLPSIGPTMLVVNEELDDSRLDVWWGVHNGCHLDLLGWHGEDSPFNVEFGRGLLVSEALSVVLEILAALEAKGPDAADCRQTVAKGLIERAGRLALPDYAQAGASYLAAQKCLPTEFADLPTVAAAYVCGPLQLLAADFNHPSIPRSVAHRLRLRLQAVGSEVFAFRKLSEAAVTLFGH